MHAFDHRLNQLLDQVADLTPARRQRLTRSLRQDDVELGVRAAEASLDAALKASLRVAAHELLDTFCLHLEAALARARTDHARALLMAIVALALAEHACVLFAADGHTSGVSFPAAETIVIAVSPTSTIDIQLARRCDRADTPPAAIHDERTVNITIGAAKNEAATNAIEVDPTAIAANPFEIAARALAELRQ